MHPVHLLHPFVLCLFFATVIGLTMFSMHPVLLVLSLIGAICVNLTIDRSRFFQALKWFLPFCIIAALINPLITHDGEKVLLYVNYQPITVEAIAYGIAMSTLILAVMLWCMALNQLMTTDQFIYLFGTLSPAVALLISVTMRLVPRFKYQLQLIMTAQKAIGRDPRAGSVWQRIKRAVQVISILITWALENAIESADSMKARGYGLSGRTTFSIFTFTKRDGWLLVVIVILLSVQILGHWQQIATFDYYPTFRALPITLYTVMFYSSFFVLALLPTILYVQEGLKWRLLTSKISASVIHSATDKR